MDDIFNRLSNLEKAYDAVLAEQSRISLEVNEIKEILSKQQATIEKLEIQNRKLNLIITGIPETSIECGGQVVMDEKEKLTNLGQPLGISINNEDISYCARIGRKRNNAPRPLKVTFSDIIIRNTILYNQKLLRANSSSWHGNVFANKDLPYLTRLEDKRLRERMKNERFNAAPKDVIFLKNGNLYKNGISIDSSNVTNQLF